MTRTWVRAITGALTLTKAWTLGERVWAPRPAQHAISKTRAAPMLRIISLSVVNRAGFYRRKRISAWKFKTCCGPGMTAAQTDIRQLRTALPPVRIEDYPLSHHGFPAHPQFRDHRAYRPW